MSKNYKCDRCGELYSNPTGKSNKYIIIRPDFICVEYKHCLNDGHIDLCPNCHEQLRKWLGEVDDTSCSNCKHHGHTINTEPCFSCLRSIISHKCWESKEDEK